MHLRSKLTSVMCQKVGSLDGKTKQNRLKVSLDLRSALIKYLVLFAVLKLYNFCWSLILILIDYNLLSSTRVWLPLRQESEIP